MARDDTAYRYGRQALHIYVIVHIDGPYLRLITPVGVYTQTQLLLVV